ncbi:MAG: hypothetical protein ACE5HI_09495, partial [bacterium]
EIKTDNDISNENRAKLRYAREHFKRVNELQSQYKYYFKFLSPASYDLFFHDLREAEHKTFKSKIEAELEEILLKNLAEIQIANYKKEKYIRYSR